MVPWLVVMLTLFVVVCNDTLCGGVVVNVVGIFVVFEEVVAGFIMDVVVVVDVVFVVVMVESVVLDIDVGFVVVLVEAVIVVMVAFVLAAAIVVADLVVIWDVVIVGAVDTVVDDVVVIVAVVVMDFVTLLMVAIIDGVDTEPFLTMCPFSAKLGIGVGSVVVEWVIEYVGISIGVVVLTETVSDCDVSLAFERVGKASKMECFFVFNLVSMSSLLNDV